MEFHDLHIKFRGATPYIFYFENVHLLMLSYERDDARFVFRIAQQSGVDITLDFPGETFVERVLDTLAKVFFIQVQEGEGEEAVSYVIGSFFELDLRFYGAYYQRNTSSQDVVLFRLRGEAPDFELEAIEGDEYTKVSRHFLDTYV